MKQNNFLFFSQVVFAHERIKWPPKIDKLASLIARKNPYLIAGCSAKTQAD